MSFDTNGARPASPGLGLGEAVRNLWSAVGERGRSLVSDQISEMTERLTKLASGQGGAAGAVIGEGLDRLKSGESPASATMHAGLKGAKDTTMRAIGRGGDDKSGKGKKNDLKVTNILESIDVGVPVSLAYDQWTQFEDFPGFMKKVESVEQEEDAKLKWKAQVLWSHRTWESTIIDQAPDQRIVWRSEAEKGTVDGTVTFHEVTPDLTRILLALQYHPQGFMERTGNIWRAQGRRVRLELKHFVRHVMSEAILHPEDVEGWRGEIRDGEVVDASESAEEPEAHDETRGGPDGEDMGEGRNGVPEDRPRRQRVGNGDDRPSMDDGDKRRQQRAGASRT
jgi:uncharacterized membrane protein